MTVHDLRLFILILEIIIFISTFIPITIYVRNNRRRTVLIQHLDVAYSIMWVLVGFVLGMTLISILSVFVK